MTNTDGEDIIEETGNKITYDEIGNPLTYYNGMEFSWTMGRRLSSITRGNSNTSYTYNADGLRTSKKINAAKFNYYWNGDKLTGQTWQGNTLYFYYDKDGNPIGFDFNDTHYDYITNLQGDIIAVLNGDKIVAEYEYDAWGNCTILQNLDNIANTNPLRYRGYYLDTDTGLYYLQSRYYDSNIGRFINADDAEILTENHIILLENNIFSYCYNDPVSCIDKDGRNVKKVKKAKIVKINCKYNRLKALNYMMKWYNGRNSDFYDGSNGDCANFVSQCMNAAGMKMNDNWKCNKKGKFKSWFSRTIKRAWSFGYDYTKSWGHAESHYDFFKKSSIVHHKYTIYSANQIDKYFNNWNIRPGDIVYYFEKKKIRKPIM